MSINLHVETTSNGSNADETGSFDGTEWARKLATLKAEGTLIPPYLDFWLRARSENAEKIPIGLPTIPAAKIQPYTPYQPVITHQEEQEMEKIEARAKAAEVVLTRMLKDFEEPKKDFKGANPNYVPLTDITNIDIDLESTSSADGSPQNSSPAAGYGSLAGLIKKN